MSNQRGYTLVELMVVVAIMGVLSNIGYANFLNMKSRARDAVRVSDMAAIEKAIRLFDFQFERFPGPVDGIPNSGQFIGEGQAIDRVLAPYFTGNIPTDPLHDTTIYFYSYDPSHCLGCDCFAMGASLAFNKAEGPTTGIKKEVCSGGNMNQQNADYSRVIRSFSD